MFINFTNHPSSEWNDDQVKASEEYGDIVDVPFPNVPPSFEKEDIIDLADRYTETIASYFSGNDVVLAQGEFTLCFAIVCRLQEMGIRVVSACTERITEEKTAFDGTVKKVSFFKFIKYRDYA